METIKLDIERTVVRSPVDGWVPNLLVRPGDFAQVGAAKLAVIDQHSFWVYGYFEEHKLKMIKVGDQADIQLLGSQTTLKGHVESIAHGITDRDNPTDIRLLANVNPTFNWVRLAQRIPVRIHLAQIPAAIPLVAGMTCSVVIRTADACLSLCVACRFCHATSTRASDLSVSKDAAAHGCRACMIAPGPVLQCRCNVLASASRRWQANLPSR